MMKIKYKQQKMWLIQTKHKVKDKKENPQNSSNFCDDIYYLRQSGNYQFLEHLFSKNAQVVASEMYEVLFKKKIFCRRSFKSKKRLHFVLICNILSSSKLSDEGEL